MSDKSFMTKKWYTGKVIAGTQTGRKIGFPTVNIAPQAIGDDLKTGVYACFVKIGNNIHPACLYFGPRLVFGEQNLVLEIHILDFEQNFSGKIIEFCPITFIREARGFDSLSALAVQIQDDVSKARKILSDSSKAPLSFL